MAKSPLEGLLIRTGVVRAPDVGYLLAADPTREEQEEAHTVFFKWGAGKFTPGSMNFSAQSCCLVTDPALALVCVAPNGHYSITAASGKPVGNIFDKSQPKPQGPRYGDIRSVSTVAGKAFAVGLEGMAYRLDDFNCWTRIDDGLPRTFGAEAVHGFSGSDLYAVGLRGEMWHYDGKKWNKCDLPTNVNLSCVCCAADGTVYAAGHQGVLVSGHASVWKVIDHWETKEPFWDLEWFGGELYLSTLSTLFRLKNDKLSRVQFGQDVPKTCNQLSATTDVLWSVGEKDVLSFDGRSWFRVV
jgi:hypothetical protein